MCAALYPAFLPALDDVMTFRKDGRTRRARVVLTDGGVYDNLGLTPLWPDRDPDVSLHVDRYDLVVVSRAGYALRESPAPSLWPSRMRAVVDSLHARSQNLAVNRAFDLQRAGRFRFILSYLDQKDETLSRRPADLVTRERVTDYPTDFSAMSDETVLLLSKRGEQVTRALIDEHLGTTVVRGGS